MIIEVAVGSGYCCRVLLFVLCSGFSVSVLGDSESDDAGVVDGCFAVVIDFVLQGC